MTQFEKNLRIAIGINRGQAHDGLEAANGSRLVEYLGYLNDPTLDGL